MRAFYTLVALALVNAGCGSANAPSVAGTLGNPGGSSSEAGSEATSGGAANGGAANGGTTNGGAATAGAAVGGAASGGATGGTTGDGTAGGNSSGGSTVLRPPPNPCIANNSCPPGTWVNVTPPEVNLDPNLSCSGCNYGALDVLADPVRPSDFYIFICYQGAWKSVDYGMTWTKVSKGMNSDLLESGRPWMGGIDPSTHRDPNTPPALYTASGYGSHLGLYKSIDGGNSWTIYPLKNTQGAASDDVYAIDVDPGNSNHLIAGFHDVGLSESTDGGKTWTTIKVPNGFGKSVYPKFVLTGSAATTSTTWISLAQWENNTNGMWRTTDSGKTWTQVNSKLEHGHGSGEIYQDGKGNIYAAGSSSDGPLQRSADYGVTWAPVKSGMVPQNGVFGTPNFVYAELNGAILDGLDQHLQRSPASDGVNWSDWQPTAPKGMTNGNKRAAVSFDGSHYVIVTGNYLAGIWRYVE